MVSQAFGIVNILVFYKSKEHRNFYVQRTFVYEARERLVFAKH